MERNIQAALFLRQDMNQILHVTQDHYQTLQWLRENQLLRPSFTCCQLRCNIIADRTRLDGEEFRCVNRGCRRRFSIRVGTVWENFRRVPLVVLVRLVFYYYIEEISASKAARFLQRTGFILSSRAVRRIYSDVRRMVLNHMQRHVFPGLLRGTIEIDEALFTHRAGPGRRGLRQVWAIGLVERRSGLGYVFIVPDRTSATINRLIRRYTLRGSLIIHDGWHGYTRIPQPWRQINVNTNDNYTTSQVEGLWGQLRARIRNIYSAGVVEGNVEEVLTEVLWRRNVDFEASNHLDSLIDIMRI